jgi:hypothetical protein
MSYQPQPSSFASAPSAPTPTAAPRGRRKPLLIVLGAVVLLGGLGGGGALVSKSKSSVEDNAQKLARAPGGCVTTLQFDKTGTFLVYFESKGKVTQSDGDCAGNAGTFARTDDNVPALTLSLADADGKKVDIQDASGKSYDAGGFQGTLTNEVTIDTTGVYRLSVDALDDKAGGFAIAIGKDPKVDESKLKTGGGAAALAGLVLGGLLLLLGLRRGKPAAGAPAAAAWAPQYAQPGQSYASPPTAPYVPPSFATPPTFDTPPSYTDPTQQMPWTPIYGEPTQQMPTPPTAAPFSPPHQPPPDDRP